jgi:ATP-dependent phosphoenolpyruvate carboxykinase
LPRASWAGGGAYAAAARELGRRFIENFKQFAGLVPPGAAAARPRLSLARLLDFLRPRNRALKPA